MVRKHKFDQDATSDSNCVGVIGEFKNTSELSMILGSEASKSWATGTWMA